MPLIDGDYIRTLHERSRDEARRINNICQNSASMSSTDRRSTRKSRPRYRVARTRDEEPVIPAKHIFAFPPHPVDDIVDDETGIVLPSVAECATHLELLGVFFKLRSDIINSPDLDTVFGVKQVHRVVYRRVSGRFQRQPFELKDPDWAEKRRRKWEYFLTLAVARFDLWVFRAASTVPEKQGVSLKMPYLPPLDILMVWHAFLLNPKCFQRYCQTGGRDISCLRRVSFPWQEIHNAVDSSTLTLTLPAASASWYTTTFNLPSDLVSFLKVWYHQPHREALLSATTSSFGSRQFRQPESTSAATLSRHLNNLRSTVTASEPPPPTNEKKTSTLAFLDMLRHAASSRARLDPLAGNVTRQAAFVDKMHRHLWLRAPSLAGTLRRAVGRYDAFLRLFVAYPGETLVPTLDIDLVWHTHQLGAGRYQRDVLARTGRFIDHDDKLGGGVLKGGMDRMRELWRIRVGGEYEVCLCWECEAVVDAWEEMGDDGVMEGSAEEVADEVQKEVEYYRMVEMARRYNWKMLPVREKGNMPSKA
ncbi:hypothetical protein N658DRAFT_498724 [Parathielavia hyrcaniae]|uniref:Uncharacterized protein n=1 Tax=Parathielavia hyrcaniae TaxID=113614 RepID=A0AAN6Q163_9PEZI|nr:hypothetical protein N658DRAFT_498724 [Parathielavia hyrcaniae]